MSWHDHDEPNWLRGPPPKPPAPATASELHALALKYRKAAGDAFTHGDADTDAKKYREAAEAIEALAAKLPPLPGPVTR